MLTLNRGWKRVEIRLQEIYDQERCGGMRPTLTSITEGGRFVRLDDIVYSILWHSHEAFNGYDRDRPVNLTTSCTTS